MQIYSPETARPTPLQALRASGRVDDDAPDRGLAGVFALGMLTLLMATAAVSSLVVGAFPAAGVLLVAAVVAGTSTVRLGRAIPVAPGEYRG
jgi:hypothetical protein